MSKFILSKALGTIPDDMLLEAMETKRRGRVSTRLVRIAAMAAALALLLTGMHFWPAGEDDVVTMPGILKAYACDIESISEDELEQYALVESLEQSYQTMWAQHINVIAKGITISLLLDDDSLGESDIDIEVSTNFGELRGNHYRDKYFVEGDIKQSRENAKLGKKGTIDNGEAVFWTGFELLDIYAAGEKAGKSKEESFLETGGVFVEFIVRVENHIVGYAVMEIISVDYESEIFGIELRDSAYFPKVDGEYQNVTQEYLEKRIRSAKAG